MFKRNLKRAAVIITTAAFGVLAVAAHPASAVFHDMVNRR